MSEFQTKVFVFLSPFLFCLGLLYRSAAFLSHLCVLHPAIKCYSVFIYHILTYMYMVHCLWFIVSVVYNKNNRIFSLYAHQWLLLLTTDAKLILLFVFCFFLVSSPQLCLYLSWFISLYDKIDENKPPIPL